MNNYLKQQTPGPYGFAGRAYQTFWKEIIPIFLQFLPEDRSRRNTF